MDLSFQIKIERAFIIVIGFTVLFLSCQKQHQSNTPTIEIFDKVYPPLNYRIKGAVIDGKKIGLWTTFDSLGRIEMEETYLNGKSFGALKIYSNRILAIRTFDKIILNDTVSDYEKYNFHGKVIVKGQYVNSQKRGIWTYYFENGKDLKAKVKFLEKDSVFLFKSPQYSKDNY